MNDESGVFPIHRHTGSELPTPGSLKSREIEKSFSIEELEFQTKSSRHGESSDEKEPLPYEAAVWDNDGFPHSRE
jgi:hypothetical protein